ncbi:hypothetical protein [Salipiger abyssi]
MEEITKNATAQPNPAADMAVANADGDETVIRIQITALAYPPELR